MGCSALDGYYNQEFITSNTGSVGQILGNLISQYEYWVVLPLYCVQQRQPTLRHC